MKKMKKKTFEFAFVPPQTMLDAGITPVVIAYLNGQLKKLPEDLSWAEFAYIWSVEKEKFEKTSLFYKKKMDEFNSVDSRIVNDTLVLNLKEVIKIAPLSKDLFKKHLPVREAFALCDEFYENVYLFMQREGEIGSAFKTEIIQKLIDLSTQERLSTDEFLSLKEIVGHNKQFKPLVELMIDIHLRDKPDDYDQLKLLKGMSERRKNNYILELQNELSSVKHNEYPSSLFSQAKRAYKETKDIAFIEIMTTLIQKMNANDKPLFANQMWDRIKSETGDFNNADIVPILSALSENHQLYNYGYFIVECLNIIEKVPALGLVFPER